MQPQLFSFRNSSSHLDNDMVFADTSFMWELYGSSGMGGLQQDCRNFTSDAVQKGSVIVYSPKIEEELTNVIVKEKLKVESKKLGLRNFERKQILSNVPDFMSQVNTYLESILSAIESNPNFLRLDHDASLRIAREISSKFNMDISDSLILATMKVHSITRLATIDKDYMNVKDNDFSIFTDEATYQKLLKEHGLNDPRNNT